MSKIAVLYSEKQIANSGSSVSPSASKPKWVAEALANDQELTSVVEFIDPEMMSAFDIAAVHEPRFVDEVIKLKRPNGFGTYSKEVIDSLFYTNGAMFDAAKLAINTNLPTAALVSGFHHAAWGGFEDFGYFCTFNGLMVAAKRLIREGKASKVAIVDCDHHWGNGTDDIIDRIDPHNCNFLNISFGKYFNSKSESMAYLAYFEKVREKLSEWKPDVILYQSGADVHENDPLGGLLSEDEMMERDEKMFTIAKELEIPICWNLAGGYQQDEDGSYGYVVKLHVNTFKVCRNVYGI